MRLLVAIAAVIFLGDSAPPACADFMDGKVLASLCTSDVDWLADALVSSLVLPMPLTIVICLALVVQMAANIHPCSATREEIVGLVRALTRIRQIR